MAYNPGRYRVELYVDNEVKATHTFVVAWEFTEHRLAADVQTSDPYVPQDPRDVFYQDDARALTWANFDMVAQGSDLRCRFYDPTGALYTEVSTATSPDYRILGPAGPHEWKWWSRAWAWMDIAGASAVNKPGDWRADVSVRNPASGAWDQIYSEAFEILERPAQNPSVEVEASPQAPQASESITLTVSASDNTLLDRVTLHWNDGSDHSQEWTEILAASFAVSHPIGGFPAGTQLTYWAEAWDTSSNRLEGGRRSIEIAPKPTVALALAPTVVNEDDDALLTATLSEATPHTVTVMLGYTGSAARGVDYVAPDAIVVVAGQLSSTVVLATLGDHIVELPSESVTIDISGVDNGTESSPQQVTAQILDDDHPADPYEPDSLDSISLQMVPDAPGHQRTFHAGDQADYALVQGSPGSRYTIWTSELVGDVDTAITVFAREVDHFVPAASDDNGGEQLASRVENVAAPADGILYVEVVDLRGGQAGAYVLSVETVDSSVDIFEPDNDRQAAALVAVDGSAQAHTFHVGDRVDWAVFPATAGAEYTIWTDNLLGDVDTTLSLYTSTSDVDEALITDDNGGGGSASRIAGFASPVTGDLYVAVIDLMGGADGSYDLHVSGVVPEISIADIEVVEGDTGPTSALLTVLLSEPSAAPVTVDYATGDATATGGEDYTHAEGEVTFAPGSTSAPIDLVINGDTIDEVHETFVVSLSNAVNGVIAIGMAAVTILDDDGPAVTITDAVVNEADGEATLFVQLSAPSPQVIVVDYATEDGTAQGGNGDADYESVSDTVTFPAGHTTAMIGVVVTDDMVSEDDELFAVTLSNAVNAEIVDETGIVTIEDNDDPAPSFVRIGEWIFDGALGNGDGWASPGERVEPRVRLLNDGPGDAKGVPATLEIADPDVAIVTGSVTHATWPAGEARNNDGFVLDISPDAVPHDVSVDVHLTADNGGPWELTFTFPIVVVTFAKRKCWIYEPTAMTRNGYADPGERILPRVRMKNEGPEDAQNVIVTLSIADPDVIVVNGSVTHAT